MSDFLTQRVNQSSWSYVYQTGKQRFWGVDFFHFCLETYKFSNNSKQFSAFKFVRNISKRDCVFNVSDCKTGNCWFVLKHSWNSLSHRNDLFMLSVTFTQTCTVRRLWRSWQSFSSFNTSSEEQFPLYKSYASQKHTENKQFVPKHALNEWKQEGAKGVNGWLNFKTKRAEVQQMCDFCRTER